MFSLERRRRIGRLQFVVVQRSPDHAEDPDIRHTEKPTSCHRLDSVRAADLVAELLHVGTVRAMSLVD